MIPTTPKATKAMAKMRVINQLLMFSPANPSIAKDIIARTPTIN